MNRVIITGGNGFIGNHLVKKLLTCKLHSLVLISNTPNISDKYSSDRKFLKDMPLRFYTADIRDGKAISDIFLQEKADTCIHLAAKISVADSIRNPEETMDINVKGTLNLLDACYNSGVNNFLFASSAAVYGDVTELPIPESCILRPLSPYGKSKMLAEQHVLSYRQQEKIKDTISLRFFNVYGPGQTTETDVVTRFATRLSRGLPPIVHGDGKYTRDFISVDDVTEAIILSIRAMDKRKNRYKSNLGPVPVFNIGTGRATSIKELAEKMIAISGIKLDPIYEEGYQDRVILHSYADMSKSENILGFVAKKDFETGLREILERVHVSKSHSK